MNLADPAERGANVGEYVLGTLDDAERAEFELALGRDGALRAEVSAWQDRLWGLHRLAPPEVPSAALWGRIEQRLPRTAADGRTTVPASSSATGASFWQRLGLWQALTGVAVAAAVLLGLHPMFGAPDGGTGPRYVAVLQSPQDASAGWLVEARVGGALRLEPIGAKAPAALAGHSLQFWTKPVGANKPTSMGLVPGVAAVEMPASRLPALGDQQLFEITLEAEGGSPIGKPTGPILYVGRAVQAPG